MQRIGTTNGLFIDGDQTTNTKGTICSAAWLNAVQEEIAEAIEGMGGTLNPAVNNQLLALLGLVAQENKWNYSLDTGTANTYQAAYTPPVLALTDGMILSFRAKNANTGAATFSANGLNPVQIYSQAHVALLSGEIAAGGFVEVEYNSSLGGVVLLENSGGIAHGISPAPCDNGQKLATTAFAQKLTPVVGSVRNLRAALTAAGTSLTITADELVVETALGGGSYKLPSFNKTINTAGTGPGGMDIGAAPVSGCIGIYAIYNPTTGASALLGVNASAGVTPSIYGGANMPAGYTASALISVWQTNSSGQFITGNQLDRRVSCPLVQQSNATGVTSFTPLTLTVPYNARSIAGYFQLVNTGSPGHVLITIGNDQSVSGDQVFAGYCSTSNNIYGNFMIDLITPKTIYWSTNVTSMTAGIFMSSYTF